MHVLHKTTVSKEPWISIYFPSYGSDYTRPGWREFLRETATKYEMHVYTMGTRAYAEEVCAAIDPDGKAFGGRVLSRDESGSESPT